MATNKRKDAAALFELLDNSTLKVPKNAGSLKIPSWWSSKTNPAPERIDHTLEDDYSGVAVATPVLRTIRPPATVTGPVAPAPVSAPAQAQAAHLRLFEPAPVNQTPAATPSIRPPSAGEPAARSAQVATPPAALDTPVAPRDPQVFAPETYAEKRRQWITPRPGAFARLPNWALMTGLGVIVVIIMGTIVASHLRDKKVSAAPVGDHPTPADAARAAGANSVATPSQNVPAAYAAVPAPRADKAARVFEPGTAARTPEQYYVIVARTPSKAIAERNAKFLADHGIDVSTEIDGRNGLFVIISVQGFPSNTAAKLYRDRIVEIGHLTDDYKKSRRAWDDAMVLNGLRMTPQ